MKITDARSFGKAVRERRKELHCTQAFLSECTGLSITFLSDLERGKPGIQLEKSIQVVNILGMDLFMEKRGE